MKFEYRISQFLALGSSSLKEVLTKINSNKRGIIFLVDDNGTLLGALTDGDFRRWAVTSEVVELSQSAANAVNADIVSFRIDESPARIKSSLNSKIEFIPLLDKSGRIVAVASNSSDGVWIGNSLINDSNPTYIIAEIGINHNGKLVEAKRLIDAAVACGADCAKFQMRDMKALYSNSGNSNDHSEDLGSQYILDILSKFQLSDAEMFEAFDYCKLRGITPLCTPWDLASLKKLEKYGMSSYKVASADLTNHDLLLALISTGKSLIISTGMSSESEIVEATTILKERGANYVLLHCNSTYPAPFKDINLQYLHRLKEIGDCPVGYSGHERGISIALAAVAMGCRVVEKHFTFDTTQEGNDHKVSLMPSEFQKLVEGIRQIELAMGSRGPRQVTQGEKMNRENLAKSLIVNCDLKKGQLIESNMLDVKSPGKGIQPNRRSELVGKFAKRQMAAGSYFFDSDLGADRILARKYTCRRKWGVPVRFHDFQALLSRSNPDFLEFHLSYKDLELNIEDHLKEPLNVELVVHSPDLFTGDHLLDLASSDEAYRNRSIAELQRVIEFTRKLAPYFNNSKKIKLVASLGGFTRDSFVSERQCDEMFETIANSLAKLDTAGVEILAQTLPPFPWYLGGQLYLNIFTDHIKTAQFCKKTGMRLCFDVSHSKLSCNHWKISFNEYVKLIGPHTAHLHLVDAAGIDGEGLQIGEGEIDFSALGSSLDHLSPSASFIPEIWQGHKDDGEAFWVAMEKLEKWF